MQQAKKLFLDAFREVGIIKSAAKVAGVARSTVYRWQEEDDQFAAAFREAEIEATETMEAEAFRRAVLGIDKPIYHQGVKVDTVKEYSDTLLIFTLKARAPEKYRERHDIKHGGQIEHVGLEHAKQVLRVSGGSEQPA